MHFEKYLFKNRFSWLFIFFLLFFHSNLSAFQLPDCATDLMISEYGEGSVGNSKFIEIYNGTGADVNLSNYQLWRVINGGTWAEATLNLTGTLANGATLVVANNASDVPAADIYNAPFVSWNGDDAVGLAKDNGAGTFVLIDVVGTDGADPGAGWDVAGVTNGTVDNRLTRKTSVLSPNSSWVLSAGTDATSSEWIVVSYSTGSANNGHSINCGSPPPPPALGPEINLVGNGNNILNGDLTPSLTDDTDFGSTPTASGSIVKTFTIENLGDDVLNLTGTSPFVIISGANATDFSVTQLPSSSLNMGTSTTFQITFDPQADGIRTATLTLSNNDTDENPYAFNVQGTGTSGVGCPTDLFISEYIEGSGNNKAIEIFNPTGSSILLDNYDLVIYANGSTTPTSTINFTSGTSLASGSTYLVVNSGAVAALLTLSNQTSGSLTFNGDDAVALRKLGVNIDVLGQIGFDPGTGWSAGGCSTLDRTMVRNAAISTGDINGSDPFDPSLEWTCLAVDDFSGAGSHTSDCFGTPSGATITLTPNSLSGFNYTQFAGPSAEQTLTVSGSNLTEDIILSAPANYEISLTSGAGFVNSLSILPTAGNVSATTIFVRLVAGLAAGSYNGNVTANSTGALQQTSTLSGSVTASSCTPAVLSGISPLSGPVGTVVTITASSGDLTNATVTIGGVAATVLSSSPNTLVISVPSGSVGGVVLVNDSQPCTASAGNFNLLSSDKTNCESVTSFSELFISQVTDATVGSLSYVEIANATPNAIDMSNFLVRFNNNGSLVTDIPLSGILVPGDSFTLATNTTDGNCPVMGGDGSLADQINVFSGVNDNDCISLVKNGVVVDVWGVCGANTNWIAGLGLGTKGYDFQRKSTSTAPSLTFNSNDWTIFDFEACSDNYTDVENYDPITGLPVIVTNPVPPVIPECSIVPVSFSVSAVEGLAGGKPLAYQWFVNTPGSTDWLPLTNGGVYSGAQSATLNISSISNLNQFQFYCQVREDDGTCFRASDAVNLDFNTVSTIWNGTAWTNNTPDLNAIVQIEGAYNTSANGSFDACSLRIQSPNSLQINAGDFVKIRKDLTVALGGDLQVLHEGSLIMIEDAGVVTVNGTLNVHKTSTPMVQYDYAYWSSPVVNERAGSGFANFRQNYMFDFNTAAFADVLPPFDGFDDNGDVWRRISSTTVLTPGKGYIAMNNNNSAVTSTTSTVAFSGVVNNGQISIPLSLSANSTDPDDDWNLIGNPYPSAINAVELFNLNSTLINGTFYFWTHNSPISSTFNGPDALNFTANDYAMFNVGTGGIQASTGGAMPNGFIASGQAFFVEASQEGNFIFNNSTRLGTEGMNDRLFRANKKITDQKIWLNLTNSQGAFNQILIGFIEGATNDYESFYDGRRLESGNFVSFYSFSSENEKLAIQGRSPLIGTEDVIPLGFHNNISENIPFQISLANVLAPNNASKFVLEDKLEQVFHDLSIGDYQFYSATGTFDNRFFLHVEPKTLSLEDENLSNNNALTITRDGNQLTVNSSLQNIVKVHFYDITGKRIIGLNSKGKSFEFDISNHRKEFILAKILLEDGNLITKKIIVP